MKQVKMTKRASIYQMCNMADNITEACGKACLISTRCFSYTQEDPAIPNFRLYISDVTNKDNLSWTELYDEYLKCMEGTNE